MDRSHIIFLIKRHLFGWHIRKFRDVIAATHCNIAVHTRHFQAVHFRHQFHLFFGTVHQLCTLKLRICKMHKWNAACLIYFLYDLLCQRSCTIACVMYIYLISWFYLTGIVHQIFCQSCNSVIHHLSPSLMPYGRQV